MGLWITLRQNMEVSYFRHHLLNLLSKQIRGNYVILASGYFHSRNYEILDHQLLQAIQDNDDITDIMVIGAMGSSSIAFTEFCDKLDNEWGGNVIQRKIKGNNWHAKIAMKLQLQNETKIPVCAIIGSSNLTRPAYGILNDLPINSEFSHFNHECDVVIFTRDWFNGFSVCPPDYFPGFKGQDLGSIYFSDLPDGCPDELSQMEKLLIEIEENITIK